MAIPARVLFLLWLVKLVIGQGASLCSGRKTVTGCCRWRRLRDTGRAQMETAGLAYCLYVTLRRWLRDLAPGLTPRSVLEKFAAVQMAVNIFYAAEGRAAEKKEGRTVFDAVRPSAFLLALFTGCAPAEPATVGCARWRQPNFLCRWLCSRELKLRLGVAFAPLNPALRPRGDFDDGD